MNNTPNIDCDLLVIGRGFAGMAAAAKAASLGLRTVQAGSGASLFLASGLIDLLGVYPTEKGQILGQPEPGLENLRKTLPGHPYAKVSSSDIFEHLSFLRTFLQGAGLDYTNHLESNQFVLTAAGTFKPSFLIPKTFSKGSARKLKDKQVLFVDFHGLKGFSARQMASSLEKLCARTLSLTIENPDQSVEITPVALANAFDDEHFLAHISEAVATVKEDVDLIGFPALCGIHNNRHIFQRLEKMIGRPCFEIPGLPPSIPGLRLKNAFEKQLSRQGVTVLNNAKIRFESHTDQGFDMTAQNQNMETPIRAKGVVLATGRFQGNGLHARRGLVEETVFGLNVHQPDDRNQWYDLNFFHPAGHGVNQAGIETTDCFQPMDDNGAPRFEHLYAAGSVLAYNDGARLKSGGGVSCISACTAVNRFYEAVK